MKMNHMYIIAIGFVLLISLFVPLETHCGLLEGMVVGSSVQGGADLENSHMRVRGTESVLGTGEEVTGTTQTTTEYTAVPRSDIPQGEEDKYILKSQIVPPVCPACPTNTKCTSNEPPPPCPPCARCPEPAFECKKVPNYRSFDSTYLPKPVLNDFSTFGA